jgi:4-amino-4-deoxy-L-arabinose transferase-like glycosyltransferase
MQYINRLPFDEQRHHPTDLYHATSPNPIGHPLFAVQVVNLVMQVLGTTAEVGRGVMAVAGVALVGVIYLVGRDLFDSRYGLLAAALAAIVPEAVRFNRTLYLDSIYALLATLLVWFVIHTFSGRSLKWTLLSGVTLGLAAATKTSAVFLLPLIVGYGAICWWQERSAPVVVYRKERKRSRSRSAFPQFTLPIWWRVVVILVLGAIVFYIFVDPASYIHAIQYPVDKSYQGMTPLKYLVAGWNARVWLLGVALYLWTPGLVIAAIAGLVVLIRRDWREPSRVLVLMVLWLCCLAPLLALHLPGLSGEHGYLPFVAPVTLLASVALMQLSRLWMATAFAVIVVTMLPATVLFGHRLMLLPYNSYLNNIDSKQSWLRPGQFTMPSDSLSIIQFVEGVRGDG